MSELPCHLERDDRVLARLPRALDSFRRDVNVNKIRSMKELVGEDVDFVEGGSGIRAIAPEEETRGLDCVRLRPSHDIVERCHVIFEASPIDETDVLDEGCEDCCGPGSPKGALSGGVLPVEMTTKRHQVRHPGEELQYREVVRIAYDLVVKGKGADGIELKSRSGVGTD